MKERYIHLYTLPDQSSISNTPVAVAEGMLIGDRQTGGIFAQLKMVNRLPRVIREFSLRLVPMDRDGNTLDQPVLYQKNGLHLQQGQEIVVITPHIFQNPNTRSFQVEVAEVIFEQGLLWLGSVQTAAVAPVQEIPEKKAPPVFRPQPVVQTETVPAVQFQPVQVEEEPDQEEEYENTEEAYQETEEEQQQAKKLVRYMVIGVAAAAVLLPLLLITSFMSILKKGQVHEEAVVPETTRVEYVYVEETTEPDPLRTTYDEAIAWAKDGKYGKAAIAMAKLGDYLDARSRCERYWAKTGIRVTISAGVYHTVGLKSDGTVVAAGSNYDEMARIIPNGQCDVKWWKKVVAVAAGGYHTLGLLADGTVVATGLNRDQQCNVSSWSNIVSVSGGSQHSVGLRADGTVVAVGLNESGQCNVGTWTDIVAIAAGYHCTLGLTSDGTVVGAGSFDNTVLSWKNIVALECGSAHCMGLKADGTVVSTYTNKFDVSGPEWRNIIAISAARNCVGVKSNGKVVVIGDADAVMRNMQNWEDIVAVSGGGDHTVGLRSDGTVVVVGSNVAGRCNVTNWKDIKLP